MNRKVGGELAYQAADADILDDGRIDTGADDGAQEALGVFEFIEKTSVLKVT